MHDWQSHLAGHLIDIAPPGFVLLSRRFFLPSLMNWTPGKAPTSGHRKLSPVDRSESTCWSARAVRRCRRRRRVTLPFPVLPRRFVHRSSFQSPPTTRARAAATAARNSESFLTATCNESVTTFPSFLYATKYLSNLGDPKITVGDGVIKLSSRFFSRTLRACYTWHVIRLLHLF